LNTTSARRWFNARGNRFHAPKTVQRLLRLTTQGLLSRHLLDALLAFQPLFSAEFTMVPTLPTRLQAIDACFLIALDVTQLRKPDAKNGVPTQTARL